MSEEIKQACHELTKAWEAIGGGASGQYHGNDYQQGLRTAYNQCAYELKEMLAGVRKPATPQTTEPSTLASATGSAPAAGQRNEMPKNWYRLVMQLEATPNNSEVIHAALAALVTLKQQPDGRAPVIKMETVNLSHFLKPKVPNAGAEAPATDDVKKLKTLR